MWSGIFDSKRTENGTPIGTRLGAGGWPFYSRPGHRRPGSIIGFFLENAKNCLGLISNCPQRRSQYGTYVVASGQKDNAACIDMDPGSEKAMHDPRGTNRRMSAVAGESAGSRWPLTATPVHAR